MKGTSDSWDPTTQCSAKAFPNRADEEEIESQTEALRKRLLSGSGNAPKSDKNGQFKPYQVHEQAAAKVEESEKLRRALGISKDYQEGSHWKRQEERLREGLGDK